ncbi:DUF4214 domain-containing protein [Pseudoduganella sp.]|uniref:DUF4214 domain-containing protein n=1 Tax=Pseudoduganella sp. TaxID=1880898 RepID=UPI0035AFD2F9
MKRILAILLSCLAAALLPACGGGNEAPAPGTRLAAHGAVQAAPAIDYQEVVQQLYVAYFGRAADTGGLANFTAQMEGLAAPVDIQDLNFAYTNNASVRALIDSFGNSAESAALYSGDNEVFLNAIYANVLNRVPDAEGKAYWLAALNGGGLTRARASFTIMAGALINTSPQGLLDARLVRNRIAVARAFTSALDTQAKASAYSGNAAAAAVRSMLAGVTADSDPNAYGPVIDATIAQLLASAVPSFDTVRGIIQARCLACHAGAGAPSGVRLDSDAGIRNRAPDIYLQVVVLRAMPLGNQTGMTDAERDIIKRWFEGGTP